VANVELATAYVTLIPSMQGAQGKIAEALMPAGAEGDKAGKNAGGMFASGFGGVLGAAAIGVAAAGAAVAGAAVGLYKVGAIFDDVTDTIRVGTGASGAALDGLVGIAQQVGAEVPTSFEKAGSTVADLNTRLGLSGDTLSTVAQQYIQAGNILGTDVDITSTTAAFSAFGIEGANVEGAMDSLFRVAQATGVGMNELASTVQTNAVPMQNLGFSFEETAALAGSLDKAGLNTSQTMASMGKSLVTLAKAGEEPQAAFKRTTGEIGEFIKSGDTAGALNLASKVFGTKGATAFVGALQSGKINLDDLTASAGLTSDTILGLGKETADAAESWQLIKNKAILALEPVGTAVFNLAGNVMGALADRMDGITEKVSDFALNVAGVFSLLATGDFKGPIFGMAEDSKFVDFLFDARDAVTQLWSGLSMGASVRGEFAGQMTGLVAIGAGIRSVFDQIGPTFSALVPKLLQVWSAFSPLQLIFGALMPVLPQIVSLIGTLATSLGGALTGALTALMPSFLELSNMLSVTLAGVFVAVMPAVLQIVGMLAGLFTQLAPVIAQIVGVVAQLVTQLIAQLAPVFLNLVTTVMPMIVTIFGAVVSAIVPLVQMIAGLLIPIIQFLMPVVVTVFGVIANVIGTVMQIVMGIIQVVTGIISGNWSQVWTGIGNIFGGIWNTIVAVVGGAIGIVGSIIGSALNFWFGLVSGALGGIGRFFADTWNNVVNGVSSMIGQVTGFFSGLIGKITGAIGNAGNALFSVGVNIVQGLISGIGSMMGAIGRAVINIVPEAIRGPFEQLLGIHSPSRVFMGYGVNIGQGLINGLDGMHGKIASSVEGLVTVPTAPSFGAGAADGSQLIGGGSGQTRMTLVVGGREFDAYVTEMSANSVQSADSNSQFMRTGR
jgi:phage-related minor tail protein